MAIGDRIPTELCASTITSTSANYFTNAGASYRTQLTQIFLCNTSATQRTVLLFKNGVGTTNIFAKGIVIPANGSIILDTKIVLTGTQTFGAGQDSGNDVNLFAYGVVEQIA